LKIKKCYYFCILYCRNKYALQEVNEAQDKHRPFNNLYELSGNLSDSIEQELRTALNRETTEDDTHPSPNDRFRYIANIDSAAVSYDTSLIRDLFTDWNGITAEMTKEVEAQY